MGRISDLDGITNVPEYDLEVETPLDNGEIMKVMFSYGESFNKGGYDFNVEMTAVHKTTKPYLEKYGVEGPKLMYCIVEILKEAYGDRGIRPFQEFKCKINDDTFTAYIILNKLKKEKLNETHCRAFGILEALSDESRKGIEEIKESAMIVEI